MTNDPFENPTADRNKFVGWALDAAGFTLKVLAAILFINAVAAIFILAAAG